MIKNIIFDFGDIFINLDKEIIFREIEKYGGSLDISPEIIALNHQYEVGAISNDAFINHAKTVYPNASNQEIINIWNGMLLDFPDERLAFIEQLAKDNNYRLFLLSNTNDLHISHVAEVMGEKFNRFRACFEKFYLSHEIQLRKPNADIFEFVLNENRLKANETFFIDDTDENIVAAEKLGIQCWHLQVGSEDVINLKTKL